MVRGDKSGPVMHIQVKENGLIIDLDNGLVPIWYQAII